MLPLQENLVYLSSWGVCRLGRPSSICSWIEQRICVYIEIAQVRNVCHHGFFQNCRGWTINWTFSRLVWWSAALVFTFLDQTCSRIHSSFGITLPSEQPDETCSRKSRTETAFARRVTWQFLRLSTAVPMSSFKNFSASAHHPSYFVFFSGHSTSWRSKIVCESPGYISTNCLTLVSTSTSTFTLAAVESSFISW